MQLRHVPEPQRTPDRIDPRRRVEQVPHAKPFHSDLGLIRPYLTDPDDEFILELAIASASGYIVTHNQGDFRDAERFGVRVAGPGEFLRII